MRKYIIVFAIGMLSSGLMAQSLSKTDSEEINARFSKFLEHTAKQEFEQVLSFLHPKQFEASSSISMKEMASLLQLLRIKLEIENVKVGKLSGLTPQNTDKYALADYKMDLKLTLNEQNKSMANQIIGGLKGQFGAENVTYDVAKNIITAKGDKNVIWIKEKKLGTDWYLIDFDPKSPQAWKSIIPEKVLTEAATKAR
ncbi:NTF2-like N-terminal transpeptidase domain-containing protein [Roseivirga echinicomitans]